MYYSNSFDSESHFFCKIIAKESNALKEGDSIHPPGHLPRKNVQGLGVRVDRGDGECQWSGNTSAVADKEAQLFEIALP